ncbi:hypothetical protein AYO41_01805 [Verrucomicrobia bacterium SCGC AG-212-E04]|nr:hypothetical protein AYO41_01805 [Verrucomicrobia bacterium SCGC AG-212-E04]
MAAVAAAVDTDRHETRFANAIMKTLLISLILSAPALLPAVRAAEQPASTQRAFETPVEAAKVFVDVLKTGENAPLIEIFGAKHRDLIGTVDPARDRELRTRLAKMAEDLQRLRVNDDGSVTMVVGYEAWPFPIPLVKTDAGWRFDTEAGFEEVLKRRIGEDELTAIATLRAYVDAQRQYAAAPRDGTQVRQFAQKLQSSPGKKDGLYWPADAAKGEEPSPGGAEIKDSKTPYAGYYYKILTAQGAAAPAGSYNYIINGRYIGGFAMVAWPADYGKTGVMTFLVNHYGDVYQKDLGEKTAAAIAAMSAYNPDSSWTKVTDE